MNGSKYLKLTCVKNINFKMGKYLKISTSLKLLGYGYCQSIEDLRHNKEISSEVMTTELLLDNSNTISHDNQVSAFKV